MATHQQSDEHGSSGLTHRFPIQHERQFYKDFPYLVPFGNEKNFLVTSEATDSHNCIAFVARDYQQLWWPSDCAHWPNGCPNDLTVQAFAETFRREFGFSECSSGNFDSTLEKISIWSADGKEPTHMAIQYPDDGGWWRSKIGLSNVDICHKLEAIRGPIYGDVVLFMAKPRAR